MLNFPCTLILALEHQSLGLLEEKNQTYTVNVNQIFLKNANTIEIVIGYE